MIQIHQEGKVSASDPGQLAAFIEQAVREQRPETRKELAETGASRGLGKRPVEAAAEVHEHLAKLPSMPGRELSIRVESSSGRIVIEVRDSETKAVLRQIPPEERLALLRQLAVQPGSLVDREG